MFVKFYQNVMKMDCINNGKYLVVRSLETISVILSNFATHNSWRPKRKQQKVVSVPKWPLAVKFGRSLCCQRHVLRRWGVECQYPHSGTFRIGNAKFQWNLVISIFEYKLNYSQNLFYSTWKWKWNMQDVCIHLNL